MQSLFVGVLIVLAVILLICKFKKSKGGACGSGKCGCSGETKE